MPRQSKGARLYLRERKGRSPIWVIRDGSTEVVCRDDGGDFIGGGTDADRAKAEEALGAYLGKKHMPNFRRGDPATVLVADVLAFYLEERTPMMEHPEIALYQAPKLNAFFAGKMIADITPSLCGRYLRTRRSEPNSRYKDPAKAPRVSESTIRRELVTLQAAITFAYKNAKIVHPVYVTKPGEGCGRERWLTRSEAARLLWGAWRTNRHVARFILVALYTGTRHEAVLKLRWGVNSEGGWVDLDCSLIYRRGTGEHQTKKKRTPVPISDRLAAHLRRWRALHAGAHVIEWEMPQSNQEIEEGKPPVRVPVVRLRRSWKSACRAAKLTDVTPHALRHTFATWAVQDGQPFGKIARALATTEKMIEKTYGHHAPDHLKEVVGSVSGAKQGRRLAV